jgi:hypothetical protein
MKRGCWLVLALLLPPIAGSQQFEEVQPAATVRNPLLSKPLGVAREVAVTARDFVTFRDPQWSVLTMGQIGAASADAATSLNNLHSCPSCSETGVSRFFVGQHPDTHKYIIGGAIEIGVEAVTAHYFRNHGPIRKWYWRALWELPQSFSLYEHARAAQQNAALDLGCFFSGSSCK